MKFETGVDILKTVYRYTPYTQKVFIHWFLPILLVEVAYFKSGLFHSIFIYVVMVETKVAKIKLAY